MGVPKTIVFVQSKNAACKIFSFLKLSAFRSAYVGMYHASLTEFTKSHLRHEFRQQGPLRCLVSTVAFGMVRFMLVCIT